MIEHLQPSINIYAEMDLNNLEYQFNLKGIGLQPWVSDFMLVALIQATGSRG